MDEIFSARRFVATVVWQKRYSRENRAAIGDVHDYVVIYAANPNRFKQTRNRIALDAKSAAVYKNRNNDPRGRWRPIPMTAQEGHATADQFYEITAPSGRVFRPPQGRCWGLSERTFRQLQAEGRIYFGKRGDSQPNVIRYLSEVEGLVPWTWWPHEEVGNTDEAKKEIHAFAGKAGAFPTPKPERLLQRIIGIATDPGDIVLDSFAGSGTTGAVAQKLGRRYALVEMLDYAESLIAPRLSAVTNGNDQGGVSRQTGWTGGAGFRFAKLGEPLFDETGGIRDDVTFAELARHVYFTETGVPLPENAALDSPLLGVHDGEAIYLLYNGILGDRRPDGGNILTSAVLADLPAHDGVKIITRTRAPRRAGSTR